MSPLSSSPYPATSLPPALVVPAIPPKPPALSLMACAVRPGDSSDPASPIFALGDEQLAILPDELKTELNARKGDAWTRGFTYAPENHWAAEPRSGFDSADIDSPPLPAPGNIVLTQGTGGTLADGTYHYTVTVTNYNGESTAPAAAQIVVAGGGGTASVKVSWQAVSEGVDYNVYGRGATPGKLASGVTGVVFIGESGDETLSWTDTGAASAGAVPPSSNTTGGIGSYSNLPIVQVIPWLVLAQDTCSTWGFDERDFKGRAQRLCDNATPAAIEREFWTGALAQANSWPNNYLTNAASYTDLTPASGSAPSVTRGMQLLQDALQQCGFGGVGMIHTQAQSTVSLLSARRVGPLLLDMFDNVIVPGAGYPGSAPAVGSGVTQTNTAVMFATDLVMVRSEAQSTVIPDSFSEAVDRGQGGHPNSATFRAMRFACAYFDAACHFAVRVQLAS